MPRHVNKMAFSSLRAGLTLPVLGLFLIGNVALTGLASADTADQVKTSSVETTLKNTDGNEDTGGFFSFLGFGSSSDEETPLEEISTDNFISFKGPKAFSLSNEETPETFSGTETNIVLERFAAQLNKSQINIGTNRQAHKSLLFDLSPNGANNQINSGYSPYSKGAYNKTAGSNIIFSLDPYGKYLDPKALNFSVGSSFLIEPKTSYLNLNQGTQNILLNQNGEYQFDRRAYNLSLGLGYAGFKIDASYSKEDSLYQANMSGYDIRVGYYEQHWEADISFAKYVQDFNSNNSFGSIAQEDLTKNAAARFLNDEHIDAVGEIHAIQFGAIYKIYPHFSLSGYYTYYKYDHFSSVLEDAHVFLLGTRIAF